MRRASFALCAAALLLGVSGCGLAGTMNVEPVAVSTQKPGNVALFVAVSQHGAGVAAARGHLGRHEQDARCR
jgi:predicted small lipoprotein YifL